MARILMNYFEDKEGIILPNGGCREAWTALEGACNNLGEAMGSEGDTEPTLNHEYGEVEEKTASVLKGVGKAVHSENS